MDIETKKRLLSYLSQDLTENKKNLIEKISVNRTRHLTVVLEDIFQVQNASAVVRSCECFGVQDIHWIKKRNAFSPMESVSKGSTQWLNLHNYTNNDDCYNALRQAGYKIVATSPHDSGGKESISLQDLDLSQKVALVFGTEDVGLTKEAIEKADACVKIDMYGFTESLNLSVSVAICLHHIITKLHSLDEKDASGIHWKLSEEEILDVKLTWARRLVSGSDVLETRFFENK